jgi:3-dehydroquinate dehydratase-2
LWSEVGLCKKQEENQEDQMKQRVLLVNGPNLNLLGTREPTIYGEETLTDIEVALQAFLRERNLSLTSFQSNHEGELIDFIQKNREASYAIINPGGLTHTSVSLRDALMATELPFIEVHISNVYARESFRHHSYLSSISQGTIVGCGSHGYLMAADLIAKRLTNH